MVVRRIATWALFSGLAVGTPSSPPPVRLRGRGGDASGIHEPIGSLATISHKSASSTRRADDSSEAFPIDRLSLSARSVAAASAALPRRTSNDSAAARSVSTALPPSKLLKPPTMLHFHPHRDAKRPRHQVWTVQCVVSPWMCTDVRKKGSCAKYGCRSYSIPWHSCQCHDDCHSDKSCCRDYGRLCLGGFNTSVGRHEASVEPQTPPIPDLPSRRNKHHSAASTPPSSKQDPPVAQWWKARTTQAPDLWKARVAPAVAPPKKLKPHLHSKVFATTQAPKTKPTTKAPETTTKAPETTTKAPHHHSHHSETALKAASTTTKEPMTTSSHHHHSASSADSSTTSSSHHHHSSEKDKSAKADSTSVSKPDAKADPESASTSTAEVEKSSHSHSSSSSSHTHHHHSHSGGKDAASSSKSTSSKKATDDASGAGGKTAAQSAFEKLKAKLKQAKDKAKSDESDDDVDVPYHDDEGSMVQAGR